MKYKAQLWEVDREGLDDLKVASVGGDDFESVRGSIEHYALVYGQDGPVEIKWLTPVPDAAIGPA